MAKPMQDESSLELGSPKDNNVFFARANVNFSIPMMSFPELREVARQQLEIHQIVNPDIKRMPYAISTRLINSGRVVQFGDKIVVDEASGDVLVYPRAVYDRFANKVFQAMNPNRGRLDDLAKGTNLRGIEAGLKTKMLELLAQSGTVLSRYVPTPWMTKVV